ncbi:MAG: four helix bundle protein [Balneolaceae bacterium]|nr:four helix bundle protein [Balneolaceae bacterium]MBO6545740.1 four helix bundle protein [Balneolaceae bacterium]MBO6647136.1 four helix bundle protein [Balneolaceae bacterium]
MKTENAIQNKSYSFALRIVKLYKFLCEEKREFTLSKQIVRSGTSIGANVEEGIGAFSKKDFRYKLSIAYKETRETKFWIKLLRDSDYIEEKLAGSLLKDCEELLKILGAILVTTSKPGKKHS